MFGDDSHHVLHILLASEEDWASLVELPGNQIKDWFPAQHSISRVRHQISSYDKVLTLRQWLAPQPAP